MRLNMENELRIIAYSYNDPLLDSPPDPTIWGWEIGRIYQDLGQRYQWQALIKDIQQYPPHYFLVRHLEELGDSLVEIMQHLTFLESLKIEVIAIEEDYSSSQFTTLSAQELKCQLTPLLQKISTKKRQKALKKGHARNRLIAVPPPGKAPYGYRKGQGKYIIDRSTAPVVKAFFEHFLLFGSLRGAVTFIGKKYGKKIAVSTGKNWLENPVYRGNLSYKKGSIIPQTHLPLLSEDEAAQIDRLLRQNRQFPPRTASAPRSLAGLVICQKCQSKMTITRMTTKKKPKEYVYLRPQNCPLTPKCKGINYDNFLTKTIENICLELPQKVSQITLPNIDNLKDKITDMIAEQKKLIKTVEHLEQQGILDKETSQLRIYNLKAKIAELQEQRSQLPPDNLANITKLVAVKDFWLGLSEEERRFYFREFIQQIFIIRPTPKEFELQLVFVF
ncbi:MAG: recombinase family protein [Microcystaceae cyanobacterium]